MKLFRTMRYAMLTVGSIVNGLIQGKTPLTTRLREGEFDPRFGVLVVAEISSARPQEKKHWPKIKTIIQYSILLFIFIFNIYHFHCFIHLFLFLLEIKNSLPLLSL